ncbi:hypothetical protein GTF94_08920 [Roseobacter sp. HKCCD5914]|uniref:hypothetical protein n=1 Tax=unclassified Roseobacter TaxID=196798 RepID=UPI001490E5CB|nr:MULTISPECIES: hypothetical protein [unclassified Roseobacter]NNV85992.1 hypothetical protein [Roseobacter sp. HKCCD8414]NNW36807.1 hypothetical protein [Roseobacter sp. HKCCD9117-2]NNX22285.1 hypothetical protein [Roseobacter sp. HKCCD8626]NNX30549.1 hypothetical protein [Roseobacter sp. HKCCD6503]NNX47963.1 hypothetical protein [Roseobacter sp. HKCCD8429]NNX52179.1 hypothetical protein [Roseobacter sp. HKCCD9024]NNY42030.1 hypothetical protein [Roseobacter sp. HKCCD8831]NNZ91021.1 hypot
MTHLSDLQVNYAFLRNSEGYPETLTGDIDLLIKQSDLHTIYHYYRAIRRDDVWVIQIIPKRRDLYVMLYFPGGGDRKFLVLEYFTGIIFRGQVIVEGERLLDTCEVDGIWRRLPDRVSISYTFFHYAAYKGHLPVRYQPDLDRHGLDPSVVADVLDFLGVTLPQAQTVPFWTDTEELRSKITQRISRRKTMWNYASQLIRMRPESVGCTLNVHPSDTQAVIDFANKYHLYRPTHRYVVHGSFTWAALKKLLIVALGGLAVVPKTGVASPGSVSDYFVEKIEKGR